MCRFFLKLDLFVLYVMNFMAIILLVLIFVVQSVDLLNVTNVLCFKFIFFNLKTLNQKLGCLDFLIIGFIGED